ncbi:non-ribosomal peptide synthetase [Paenibacillus monticola]|uniref:AMP-binding protein n=1 Tax=Paenibacillus monticola TaxID=2666075 RepID=A0A7X2H7K4_9BACL|nr:non-ribosomal peptide synthetase [Paenibacillus monticola]MRN54976.1 AMP-binding protein [Paenibacillus monticola]
MYNTLNETLRSEAASGQRGITFILGESESVFCSYSELYESALSTLHHLRMKGVGAGDEVILQLDNNREFLIVFWACLLGGIIPVPLSVGNNEEHLAKVVRIAAVLNNPFIVSDPQHFEKLGDWASRFENASDHQLSIADLMKQPEGKISGENGTVLPGDIAFIQFSSGTTGDPKGVVLTHSNLLANIRALKERIGAGAEDVFLSWMPLTHDLGMIMFHLLPLFCGTSQYLMPTWLFIRRPILWMQKADQFGATILASPNFGLKYFLTAYHKTASKRDYAWDLSSIHAIVNGAEPIDVGVCELFLEELNPYGLERKAMKMGYGMAEACVGVCIQEQDEAFRTYYVRRDFLLVGDSAVFLPEDSQGDTLALVGTGTPIQDCRVRICDDLDRQLPEGTIGHIQITGDNVTSGYYNNAEATEKLFTSDGWARTGDLGFLVEERLIVTGRTKDIIFINGSNYFPHDIERIAEEGADLKVKRMVACGIYNERTGTEEAALFILYRDKPEEFLSVSEQIRRHLNRVLGLQISVILPVHKIYQTTSGKLQRYKYAAKYKVGSYREIEAELTRLQRDREAAAHLTGRKPDGEIEETLFRLWSDLLRRERFDLEDSFFELGGTSMLVVQLFEQIEELYPGVIRLTDIYGSPSVARLSRLISGSCEPKQIRFHMETVHLSPPYFEAAENGAENHYRMILSGTKRNRLRSFCLNRHVAEEAVYLALLANMLYEISTESKVSVHTMIDGPGWIIPFCVDFATIDTIDELLNLANAKKKPGEALLYHIDDIGTEVARPKKGQALCYLGRKEWKPQRGGLPDHFDMMLEWEEAPGAAVFNFGYNAARMNGTRMRELFLSYADALESLLSLEAIAAETAQQ